jgi:hypothetical protein
MKRINTNDGLENMKKMNNDEMIKRIKSLEAFVEEAQPFCEKIENLTTKEIEEMTCSDKHADIKNRPIYNQNMGDSANAGMARDDSKTATRLLDKNWSAMVVRKYQMEGWPLFIGLITDANLNDLDSIIYSINEEAKKNGFTDGNIQSARNYCGFMSDCLMKHFNSVKTGVVEGIAVLWYIDKCFISSLYGDFMTHAPCKAELYAIINTLPHI